MSPSPTEEVQGLENDTLEKYGQSVGVCKVTPILCFPVHHFPVPVIPSDFVRHFQIVNFQSPRSHPRSAGSQNGGGGSDTRLNLAHFKPCLPPVMITGITDFNSEF